MILMKALLLLTIFVTDGSFSQYTGIAEDADENRIAVKSKLNKSGDKVLVQIQLPKQEEVFFSVEDQLGVTKHLWKKRALTQGTHSLGLPLPKLEKGKYLLIIYVGEETFKHLVFIPTSKD